MKLLKFDKRDILNAQIFIMLEVFVFACAGGWMQTREVVIPISDEDLIKHIEKEELQMRTLPIPVGEKVPVQKEKPKNKKPQSERRVQPISTRLIHALCLQESGNDPNAKGDYRNGIPMAKGILQIWPTYLEDVNRVYGTSYNHDDMFDKDKSIDVCTKYLNHYGDRYRRLTGNDPSYEVLARIHNGGPNGWRNDGSVLSRNAQRYVDDMKSKGLL